MGRGGARPLLSGERRHNPLVRSASGGRILSASQLPWFEVLPPAGYGVLTTVGRRTGKERRKCVRAIRTGDRVFLVSIGGTSAAWVKNLQATPEVRLRIRGGRFTGVARELSEAAERQEALESYCETLVPVDYLSHAMHRPGRPTRAKIKQMHRAWFDTGLPLVIELARQHNAPADAGPLR